MKKMILNLILFSNILFTHDARCGLAIMGTGGAITVSGSFANSHSLTTAGISTTLIGAIFIVAGLKVSNIQMVLLDENTDHINEIANYLRSELSFLDNQELIMNLANSALLTHLESENEFSTIYFSDETISEIVLSEELSPSEGQKLKTILGRN